MTGIRIKSNKSNKRGRLTTKEAWCEDDNCVLCAIYGEHVRSYHKAREISNRDREIIHYKNVG